MNFQEIINIQPYSLSKIEKKKLLNNLLHKLTTFHYNNCEEYQSMLVAKDIDIENLPSYEFLPFLPVRLFKEFDLFSIDKEHIVKTMTSSGTTGQQVSKIFLDKETSANQTKVLTKIISSFIGSKRIPMLIIDSPNVLKDRNMFSARGAGILGFSLFASEKEFALNENMDIDFVNIQKLLNKNGNSPFLIFGFTFMIWQHFYKELIKKEWNLDFSNAILIHGGGWKKLLSESVSTLKFKEELNKSCGIQLANIHDYYGMVEQTGSIFMECEKGYLHASIFSDVIIRNPLDFSEMEFGEKGLIEVISVLPKSYPGHVLLTEDEGILIGEDDCKCCRKGKYFHITGRVMYAEIRGCSDTYATEFK
jgi:phenylacetate-coenzyme A ligase PaaK-like adenylate-forming protein